MSDVQLDTTLSAPATLDELAAEAAAEAAARSDSKRTQGSVRGSAIIPEGSVRAGSVVASAVGSVHPEAAAQSAASRGGSKASLLASALPEGSVRAGSVLEGSVRGSVHEGSVREASKQAESVRGSVRSPSKQEAPVVHELPAPSEPDETANWVRWGIVGTGGMSNDFCCGLVKNGSTIASVAARDAARALAFGAKFGAGRGVGSYRELLEDPLVTVCYIGTHSNTHFDLTMRCLEAGKHVLCDKPLAMNARELAILTGLARRKKLFLMEGLWTRCFPVIQKAKSILDSGELGELRAVQADFGFVVPEDIKRWNWKVGGGVTLNIGIYTVAAAMLGFGSEMPSQIGVAGQIKDGVDCHASVALGYAGGSGTATMTYSFTTPLPECTRYFCERGSISIGSPAHCPSRIEVLREGSQVPEVITESTLPTPDGHKVNYPNSEGIIYEVREVERCLTQELLESPHWTLKDSTTCMRIMDEVRGKLGATLDSEY